MATDRRLPFAQMEYALSRLSDWNATAVGLYKDETGGYTRVIKRGRAWENRTTDIVTPEQFRAINAKTAYTFTYRTENTSGTLMLLIIPNEQTETARKILIDTIVKELASGIRNKRHG
jgi:hypothetical protein